MADQSDVRDIQLRLLSILKLIQAVCERHEIRFFLAYGTLLGAVRHKGFIPWDDDVDIFMTRQDYEKLFSVRDELGPDFIIQEWRTTPEYWCSYPKVRQLRPKPYIESLIADVTEKNGLFIDIFVLDGLPRERSLAQWLVAEVLNFARILLLLKDIGPRDPRPLIKAISPLARLIPRSLIAKVMEWGWSRWKDGPATWLVPYADPDLRNSPIRASAILSNGGGCSMVEFEGIPMPCPRDSEGFLHTYYGDYMQLPPEDQRACHDMRRNPDYHPDEG
ncbi:MAG: LicD family protein [Propionibacteriaceae bacterium]|nr:LicD family protein [Propionibacteriaceae bacterium]